MFVVFCYNILVVSVRFSKLKSLLKNLELRKNNLRRTFSLALTLYCLVCFNSFMVPLSLRDHLDVLVYGSGDTL